MIVSDQPQIFQNKIIAALSSANDGNMSLSNGLKENVVHNRTTFLEKAGIRSEQTTFMLIRYTGVEHFSKYTVLDESHKAAGLKTLESSVVADAALVTKPNHAIFLPLADCAGAIIYDPKKRVLMVSHLGRHSTEEQGGARSTEYLVREFQSNASDLIVWISPAVGKDTYPLIKLDGQSLHEVLLRQFIGAGVAKSNIEICTVDTAVNKNYFSHSQYLQTGLGDNNRFAIAAMMTN